MPRKANARRADGLYQRVVTIGTDASGKRIRKTVYGRTDKEAREKAEEIKILLGKGLDISAQKDTFGAWAEKWLKTRTCGQGQLTAYKACLGHVLPCLANAQVGDIRITDLQLAVNSIQSKCGLSHKTMQMIVNTIHQILELALDNNVIERNPAAKLKVPESAPAPQRREALTDEQIMWIVETPHRCRIAALIMLLCGLRRGELCALRRSDVDMQSGWIRVRRSVNLRDAEEKDGAKTENAIRDVLIPSPLRLEIERHFAEQDARKVRPIDPLVFPQATAEKVHSASSWRAAWKSYMADLNVKYGYPGQDVSKYDPAGLPIKISTFTAHQLRHTYASLLYEADIKVLDAQQYLGHAKPSTTLDIYTHLRGRDEDVQRKQIDDALARKLAW